MSGMSGLYPEDNGKPDDATRFHIPLEFTIIETVIGQQHGRVLRLSEAMHGGIESYSVSQVQQNL